MEVMGPKEIKVNSTALNIFVL